MHIMKTMKFSTNINCENCEKAVKPALDNIKDIKSWEVNTKHPDKILTVEGNNINEDEIRTVINSAGYDVIDRLDEKENNDKA